MAWAWTASRAYEALAADPRFDAQRIALWGQSRQGKTALIAGAFDERFAAIVALQSGRGGDAPTHAFAGESVAEITAAFPHWFAQRFATETPSVDQHQLLALIAPRPLLVGHGVRDGWSDPVGAAAIREAAATVYEMLGAEPPAHFLRNGGHGIHPRDWDETLNFLDAHLRS
jgi:dienelactone hydrolase